MYHCCISPTATPFYNLKLLELTPQKSYVNYPHSRSVVLIELKGIHNACRKRDLCELRAGASRRRRFWCCYLAGHLQMLAAAGLVRSASGLTRQTRLI